MAAYYNEIDQHAAQWLRNLISAGHIAPGDVDTRSIVDVSADDLKPYTQCHFFAGIGVWSHALRLSGWSDDREVWTGSCPCFPAGTLVITKRGYLPIEDVVVGDEVMTHRARWRNVTHIGSEESDLVEVKGQGHFGISCTPGHPFLVGDDEWLPASELAGSRWRTVAKFPECGIPAIPFNCGVSFVTGKYRATGWKDEKTVYLGRFNDIEMAHLARKEAIKTGAITVRGADAADSSSLGFARFLGYWVGDGWTSGESVFLCGAKGDRALLEEILFGAGLSASHSTERTSDRARCGSGQLVKWLGENFGKGAHKKRIPAWIHGASEEYRAEFMRGYFEADGHTEGENRCWTTVSRALAIGLRVLLNQAGISASITKHNTTRKANIEGRFVSERQLYRVTAYARSRSFSFSDLHGIGYVRSVSASGRDRVFNIAVAEDESYTADGIVVHNCQPFSVAGAGKGQSDERHLWPEFHRLIAARKPAVVFGEQVEAAIRHGWLDLIQADLEGSGYEFGAAGIPAAGVGAPHIRQRLWFVAERGVTLGDACGSGLEGRQRVPERADEFVAGAGVLESGVANSNSEQHYRSRNIGARWGYEYPVGGAACCVADPMPAGRTERRPESRNGSVAGSGCCGEHGNCGEFGIVEFAGSIGRNGRETAAPGNVNDWTASEWPQGEYGAGVAGAHRIHQYRTGPTNGFWRNADWLLCRDGKWRPVESTTERMADGVADSLGLVRTGENSFGLSPLKQGAKSRVGRLKAYGNAIVPQVAQAFIESYMACRP